LLFVKLIILLFVELIICYLSMTIHFVCAFVRNRAESPEAHSPGQRPVVNAPPIIRPVRAKAFYVCGRLLPLQGE
jgi:hypothetical protein